MQASHAGSINPGTRWVEHYLLPIIRDRLMNREWRRLRCLQIDPDDDSEVLRLQAEGHTCDVFHTRSEPRFSAIPSSAYDFIWTGYFGRIAARTSRSGFVSELRRICRPSAALLMGIGNRWCPIELTGNEAFLHGPQSRRLLSLSEAQRVFVDEGGFAAVHPLSVTGHFGWKRAGRLGRPVGMILDSHWRWLAAPHHRLLYASPLNPVLMLWIET